MVLVKIAACTAFSGFIYIACFQVLLALGAPLGHLAWGGRHRRLPAKLRIASLFSVGIAVLGGLCVTETVQWTSIVSDFEATGVMMWVFVGLFALSTLGNAVSKSRQERRIGTPVAFLLFVSCLILALGI